jgi:hypothetical protein
MIDYQSTLLGRTEVAEGTMAFQFEKPKHFVFKAGQYIDLTLSGSQPGPMSNVSSATKPLESPILFLQLFELAIRSLLRDPHLPAQFCQPATQPPACFNTATEKRFLFTANPPASGSRFCRKLNCVSEIGGPISSIAGVHCVGCFDGQMCGIKPRERSYQ